MILELHILQNFAPSNLNRDDTNAPKDCIFGGHRRARISSQCIKRSVRRHESFADKIKSGGGDIGVRTKRLKSRLSSILVNDYQKDTEISDKVASLIIGLIGLKLKDPEKTEYLLYFGENEISELAQIGNAHWDILSVESEKLMNSVKSEDGKKKKKSKTLNEELKPVEAAFKGVIGKSRTANHSYAADIALFGRMVADDKNMNVDAACQMAHALSTHKVDMEMDYYTAVDDLLPEDSSGSDMIGTVEFNSSCFYRYANIDLKKLSENLGSANKDLLLSTVKGFVEASIKAVPTGKQNSMAAQNPPEYARVLIRNDGFPWSLANAFQKPVRAGRDVSIEEASVEALESYFNKLSKAYGSEGVICDETMNLIKEKGSLEDLVTSVSDVLNNKTGGVK
ncbi:MAG: type I-E CRISPR-associated protein Cas7/Cse4/CasC [Proteobacteria bacterium]|nr:type I-E CRISPR-associated protein Cas7/Cse4/CasC [Pseudomonadota bacterium]